MLSQLEVSANPNRIEIDLNMHPVRILDQLCMKTKKATPVYEYTEKELGFNVKVKLEKHKAMVEGRNKKNEKKKKTLQSLPLVFR